MSETWRLIPFHVGDSQEHFEASDRLARNVGVPTIWWHSTDQPTLILGTSQSRMDDYQQRCLQAGVLVVRRQSGGTAVLAVPGVLGLDVAVPKAHHLVLSDVVESYRWLGEVWLATVKRIGIDGRLVSIEEARSAWRTERLPVPEVQLACFGSLSPYEVAVGDRKLIGLAQVRREQGVLFQSAVHLHFDPEGLANLLSSGKHDELVVALSAVATGLDEAAPTVVESSDVMEAFEQSLRETQDVDLQTGSWADLGLGSIRGTTSEAGLT